MTDQPKNVRLARTDDENAIFNLLAEGLFQENAAFSLSEIKSRAFIHQAVTGGGGIIGVIEENGEIAGTIGLNLESFWYSNDFLVSEYWNYVAPQYRKNTNEFSHRSNYAKDLINFGKWVAERMGLVLNIGIISTTRTEAKCRLYGRVLSPVGQFFMHNIEVAKGPGINKEVFTGVK